ncbi:MAG TPA: hypothetical protein VFU63_13075 [Ktedonobacterales bacterium]|nr:hypothetical protein [Ktedonobacterales bacterium]
MGVDNRHRSQTDASGMSRSAAKVALPFAYLTQVLSAMQPMAD